MVSGRRAAANRGPLRAHTVTLMLSDAEWERVLADAREIEQTPDVLISLVCALAARGDWQVASCLALADVYQYPWRK